MTNPTLEAMTEVMDEYMSAVVRAGIYSEEDMQGEPDENYELESLEDLKYLEDDPPD